VKKLSFMALIIGITAVFGAASAAAQGLPSGMIFFVADTTCPSGSSPALDAAGRVIMVTTSTSEIGKTYGTSMKDQKDNTHTHSGSMTVKLPEHHIAGASSCCNGQATTKGNHTASLTSGAATTGLPFIQLLVCAVDSSAKDAENDSMPMLSIAYFNKACPDGWDNTSLASAAGRTLLPTPLGGGAGGFIGEPLSSQEAPSHAHAKATGSITSPAKEFVLIDGCCNDNLGHSGTYGMTGSADTGHSGLPYIQYNACMKTGKPSPGQIPSGLLSFSLIPCAAPFTAYNAAAGRYVVGLNPNGQPAATFGGPNLQPGEIRTHSHTMNGSMSFPEHDIAGASGCCAHNYAASGSHGFTGDTDVDTNSSKYDSAVQAPYYTAYLCQAK
jgi:hypothetical protein